MPNIVWVNGLAAMLACAAWAAPAQQDPWASVPALPTGCYQVDGYAEKLAAAKESVSRERTEQQKINDQLKAKVGAIDPMELASRQQKFMMEHPEEAMKLMQQNQQLGETMADSEVASENARQGLEQELQDLDARYQTALDGRLAPIKVKFEDLDARASKELVAVGETWDYPAWAIAEWNSLTAQENAAYEKVCAEWWASSGPYHGFLKRYRNHLAQAVPQRENAESVQTTKVCAAKQWTRPPQGGDPSCTTSNFERVGPKATWEVQCAGEMPMTGKGEMTFSGDDSYTGSIKFTADGMNLTARLAGKKIGTCPDPQ